VQNVSTPSRRTECLCRCLTFAARCLAPPDHSDGTASGVAMPMNPFVMAISADDGRRKGGCVIGFAS
jgi:hypothetical protein